MNREDPSRAYKLGDKIIHVYHDPDSAACDPRENTNVSVMWFFHSRHRSLGDKKDFNTDYLDEGETLEDYLREKKEATVIRSVFMYEHGGIALSLGEFSDPWDSGKLGVIWTTKAMCAQTVGEDATEEQIVAAFKAELAEYNCWIEGDVWEFREVENGVEDPEHTARGGFFGDDDKSSGLLSEAFGQGWEEAKEVKPIAEHTVRWTHKETS